MRADEEVTAMFLLMPFRLAVRLLMRLKVVIVAILGGMAVAFYLQLREQQRTWGVVPGDRDRRLAGDDLVPDAGITETRTLTVEAPPSKVWPWLVQMGFGRGGWYSYDRLDMKGSSAARVLPEFQDLAVGDLVPTHPGGGFVARVVDPETALVLYLDDELVGSQANDASAKDEEPDADTEAAPLGLPVAGALGGMTMPAFKATWAFVLEPEASGTRTRLIERLRVWTADGGLPQKVGLPVMGLGVFAMTRKHMLGVKERAEGRLVAIPVDAAGVPQDDLAAAEA
jgi:hypothetical protein